jgi:hypothetical protein
MEAVAGGEDLVQELLRGVGDFSDAVPNEAHGALALLLLEGALEGISLNWDSCVERSATGFERIEVVVTKADFLAVHGARLHKVHGCILRGPTLLVSSSQIAAPPDWVLDELRGRLAGSRIVFVGIGDIPSYVSRRIEQLAAQMQANHVYVVDPQISAKWTVLLPGLGDSRRIAETAQRFFDELLRAYVQVSLRRLREETGSPHQLALYEERGIDMATGLQRLVGAISHGDAMSWVVFLRSCRFKWPALEKVVQSPQIRKLLSAAGALAATQPVLFEARRQCLKYSAAGTHSYIEMCAAAGQGSAEVIRVATERVRRALVNGRYAPGDVVTVICDGHLGPLALPSVPPSILGPEDSADLASGQDAGWLDVISAEKVLEGQVPSGWQAA